MRAFQLRLSVESHRMVGSSSALQVLATGGTKAGAMALTRGKECVRCVTPKQYARESARLRPVGPTQNVQESVFAHMTP